MMNKVEIFTDGACKGNPGPGGWGAILRYGTTEKEIYGASKNTTNNIMELTAVIESLKNIPKDSKLAIFTDSKYVITVSYTHLRAHETPEHRGCPGGL